MTTTRWETEQTYIETLIVRPTDVHEIQKAIDEIESERDLYGTDPIEVDWDVDAITLRFPGSRSSTGRE